MNGPARVNLRKTRNGFITQTIWVTEADGYSTPAAALVSGSMGDNEEEHVFKTIADAAEYIMGVYRGE